MATTFSNFKSETQLTISEETMLSTSSSSSEKKFIGNASVTNTSILNVDVTVWILGITTTGTTGSGGNWLWSGKIAANTAERIDIMTGQVLSSDMKISALASTASVININISGTTET